MVGPSTALLAPGGCTDCNVSTWRAEALGVPEGNSDSELERRVLQRVVGTSPTSDRKCLCPLVLIYSPEEVGAFPNHKLVFVHNFTTQMEKSVSFICLCLC